MSMIRIEDGALAYHCDICGAYSDTCEVVTFNNGEDFCADCLEYGKIPTLNNILLKLAGVPDAFMSQAKLRVLGNSTGQTLEISYNNVNGWDIEATIYVLDINNLEDITTV